MDTSMDKINWDSHHNHGIMHENSRNANYNFPTYHNVKTMCCPITTNDGKPLLGMLLVDVANHMLSQGWFGVTPQTLNVHSYRV